MQFEELIKGFAGRFGIAEGQINDGTAVFDIRMTPVYFVAAADGTVESGYALAL